MCPIEIIENDEEMEVAVGGSVFIFKQLPAEAFDEARTEAIKVEGKKGGEAGPPLYDDDLYEAAVVCKAYTGWRNVNRAGQPAEFTADVLRLLISRSASLRRKLFVPVMEPWNPAFGARRLSAEQKK